MSFDFTPGPWRVECGDDENDWSSFWPEIHAENGYCVVGKEGIYGDRETDLHNAKLIAVSPALYLALKRIIDEFDHQIGREHVDEYYKEARTVLDSLA